MSAVITNEYGSIHIESDVIAKIAGYAAMDCYGIVGMAAKNVRDGLVQLLKMESFTKGVRITMDDGCIGIDLHIIVEYGTNINAISESLAETVKYRAEEQTGLPVASVNVFVEGVRVDRG